MAIGQINFATIQRISDVEHFRQQQDSKPMADQQNIQGQVEQRTDQLRHQVMDPKNGNKAKNDADARDEGKNKYSARKGTKRKKDAPPQGEEGQQQLLKVGGGIDIKI
jgi:hypothetical protein